MRRTSTWARVLAAVSAAATLALGVTACSSKGGAQNTNPQAGGPAGGQRYTIAMITHEVPGDTFWDKVRNGAQQAARELNVDLHYSSNPDQGQQATLVKNAVDSKVNGIAVTLAYPDAVGPAAQAAIQAGIPTVAFNSGKDQYQKYGINMYFGSDEDLAGQAVGQRITQAGGGKTVCIIQEQGHVALETRCAGVKKTDPSSEVLYVNSQDLPAVQQTVGAKLQQDPSIKWVVALGAPIAMTVLQAKQGVGSQAQIATFDLNTDAAKAIQNGQIAFAVDQQPYVQGYMAVTSLWLNLTNGNDIGGGKPVLTGPSFVDKSNIDKIASFAQNNTR
jgi:simple sugar transport system substrate-binding protein